MAKNVNSQKAPKVVGPYSHAVISNNLVFCAGQIGVDPATGNLAPEDIESQTKQTIINLQSVLEEAGSSLDKVVSVNCFLKNISDYQKFNEVYGSFFTSKPARTTVEVSSLPRNSLVEISVIAEA